jgi:DNA mismatch repair protein MutS
VSDIRFNTASSTTDEITFPLLHDVCRDILSAKQHLAEIVEKVYLDFLKQFGNEYYSYLEYLSSYIAKFDLLITKVYLAKTYNYCRPTIAPNICETASNGNNDPPNASYVIVAGLRHCLIEHIQQNEIYVSNDIHLGGNSGCSGVLLYGTNAVGKTSFIRALGIAIILAQSGMFVPATDIVYFPYTAIFSRILGNDNLFKGLSTFAVEMTELRIIMKMADENSLVLGDELCSGTETESALSIFVAGLMKLNEKSSSYIFATHFHEIVNYEEIESLSKLAMKHMAVIYDREKDCLIYDRKLKDGSGPKIYGLEVCKSLYLDQDFLDLAYSIRNKYYPDSRGELSSPTSVYNADKIRSKCEICNLEIGEEIHHLNPQKNADVNGFIGTFHKNHKANLASVCQACHDKIHESKQTVMRKKKTTKGFFLASP